MSIKELAPHISCVCGADEFSDAVNAGYKEIYVITSKGIIKHHSLRGANRFIRVMVDSIPGYKETEIKQSISFLPAGKIPYKLYKEVESFFRKVIETKGQALEAMIFILWNAEEGYHLFVPSQTVGAASVSFDPTTLPAGSSVIVNIHSHGSMNAFFSGTDDTNDSTMIQFSGVFGKFQDPEVMTVWRFNYYKTKFEAKVSDMFEVPVREEIEIPQEWINKVNVSIPSIPKYKGGHSNLGNVGGSYDHLKKYQFQPRGKNANSRESEIVRPESSIPDHQQEFFGHNIEVDDFLREPLRNGYIPGFSPNSEVVGGKWRYNPKEQNPENAFASITEDPMEEYDLGKLSEKSVNLNNVIVSLQEDDIPGVDDDIYDLLAINHGPDVADVFTSINDSMHELDGKDELIETLVIDMNNLMTSNGKLQLFKQLYSELHPAEQEKIALFGL